MTKSFAIIISVISITLLSLVSVQLIHINGEEATPKTEGVDGA